ncbi:hypothetical protein ACU4GD_31055 [Cupriavidus basilensis]
MHEAGTPPGIFNMIYGAGPDRGRRPLLAPRRGHGCRSPDPRAPAWKWRSAPPYRQTERPRSLAASPRC